MSACRQLGVFCVCPLHNEMNDGGASAQRESRLTGSHRHDLCTAPAAGATPAAAI